MGCLHPGVAPESCIPYLSTGIRFVPLPPSGGKTLIAKLESLSLIPSVILKVNSELKSAHVMQLRVPTGMANYLLPFLTLRKVKPFIWVKYAGNWKQENAPLGYRFQRWWLSNNFLNCKVTINGKWENQPKHCFTFENPCLSNRERKAGKEIIDKKIYSPPYTACFIGRIEKEKGMQRIVDALPVFANKLITTIHFIGEGRQRTLFEEMTLKQKNVKCIFHGSVDRERIPDILAQSHFLLLPSTASEGFPKVIAEGANYGAIPVVSDISSIGQYINEQNGYVWDSNSDFNTWLEKLSLNSTHLISKCRSGFEMAELFTFESYYRKLQDLILDDN